MIGMIKVVWFDALMPLERSRLKGLHSFVCVCVCMCFKTTEGVSECLRVVALIATAFDCDLLPSLGEVRI